MNATRDISYVNITNPTVNLPWVAGIENEFAWDGVHWNETSYNYTQGSAFNVSFYPTLFHGPSGGLNAQFVVSGTGGRTGVKLPSDTKAGNYTFQCFYYIDGPTPGSYGTDVVVGQSNFTVIERYDGPTTPLNNVYTDLAFSAKEGASVAFLAAASAMACVFVLSVTL